MKLNFHHEIKFVIIPKIQIYFYTHIEYIFKLFKPLPLERIIISNKLTTKTQTSTHRNAS